MPPFPEKWWNESTIAVVTGGNKGIGFEICKQLAGHGVTTILAARKVELGTAAVEKLKEEGLQNVHFHQMDISDSASVQSFTAWFKQTHGQLHILVNNAGIAFKGSIFGAEEAKQTIDVNFRGTRAVCEALLPLMPPGGNVVNVCSRAGLLKIIHGEELLDRFLKASQPDDVESLAVEFVQSIVD